MQRVEKDAILSNGRSVCFILFHRITYWGRVFAMRTFVDFLQVQPIRNLREDKGVKNYLEGIETTESYTK